MNLRDGRFSDRWVYKEIFEEEAYKLPVKYPIQTVVDLGANIGLYTLFTKREHPEAQVICVEPDPANFELLRKNTNPYNGIYLEQAGIWHSAVTLELKNPHGYPFTIYSEENLVSGNVQAVSMDWIVTKYQLKRIDLLKVDIEGAERMLFSRDYQNWLKRVKILQIELHDRRFPGCGQAFFKAIVEVFGVFNFYTRGNVTTIVNKRIP
ncbi:MAG: FkbM family methyltransferase [Lunatimonas sp.]|uniref:FkbM family methyltransferase n=1 Tax=Lunatimonas sp. TaxID=2060141 RepID=UPI002A4719A5|nr:FkbM family methyltransferase [Lunatimonas sp.]